MSKFIIVNKSKQTDAIALTVVMQTILKGEPYKVFNDYVVGKEAYVTVVWQPNANSDRFTVFDESH